METPKHEINHFILIIRLKKISMQVIISYTSIILTKCKNLSCLVCKNVHNGN